jgi:hypothetical protein
LSDDSTVGFQALSHGESNYFYACKQGLAMFKTLCSLFDALRIIAFDLSLTDRHSNPSIQKRNAKRFFPI